MAERVEAADASLAYPLSSSACSTTTVCSGSISSQSISATNAFFTVAGALGSGLGLDSGFEVDLVAAAEGAWLSFPLAFVVADVVEAKEEAAAEVVVAAVVVVVVVAVAVRAELVVAFFVEVGCCWTFFVALTLGARYVDLAWDEDSDSYSESESEEDEEDDASSESL